MFSEIRRRTFHDPVNSLAMQISSLAPVVAIFAASVTVFSWRRLASNSIKVMNPSLRGLKPRTVISVTKSLTFRMAAPTRLEIR